MPAGKPVVESRAWAWQTVRGAQRKQWLTPDAEVEEFARHLQSRHARRVYDLGCGLGRHTVMLARMGFDVCATDLSRNALIHTDRWLQREHLGAITHLADLSVVPFPSNYFDGVVAFNVVYHATRDLVAGCLHEVRRAMKPQGELFVTFNSTASEDFGHGIKVDDHTFIKVGPPEDGIPHYFVDRPEVERLLKGFKLTRVEHREEDERRPDGRLKHAAHWVVWATKA